MEGNFFVQGPDHIINQPTCPPQTIQYDGAMTAKLPFSFLDSQDGGHEYHNYYLMLQH